VVETIAEPTPKLWGDCVGELLGTVWLGPNGITNIQDVFAAIIKFQGTGIMPPLGYVDVHPQIPNNLVNIDDVLLLILAFKGEPYPYSDPVPCP